MRFIQYICRHSDYQGSTIGDFTSVYRIHTSVCVRSGWPLLWWPCKSIAPSSSRTFPGKEVGRGAPMRGVVFITHWSLAIPICVYKLGHHWFRQWLVASSGSSHYQDQCWLTITCALGTVFSVIWIKIQNFLLKRIYLQKSSAKRRPLCSEINVLSHLPLVLHIWAITVSGSGLSPFRRQATTWANAGILSIGHLGTNFSEIWIWILLFSLK